MGLSRSTILLTIDSYHYSIIFVVLYLSSPSPATYSLLIHYLYSPSSSSRRLSVTCTSAWNQTSFLALYYSTLHILFAFLSPFPDSKHLHSLISRTLVTMTMVSLTGGHNLSIPPSPMDYAPPASVKQIHGPLAFHHHRHMWIITGPAGCGKSTVAQYVANELSIPYIEGDDVSGTANPHANAQMPPVI